MFDGASLRLYVNGELQGTQPHAILWKASGATVVGRAKYNGGNVDFFKGQIDDVRIYQGVLTDQEVAALAAGQTQWPPRSVQAGRRRNPPTQLQRPRDARDRRGRA